MKRASLQAVLNKEIGKWSGKSFEELKRVKYPVNYDNGGSGQNYYDTEVDLIERKEEYLHVQVAVSDAGWRSFLPLTNSFIVHADGRVDK